MLVLAPASQARVQGGSPVALVTAETANQLVAVELPSGRVMRRIPMPADPENVETQISGLAVVVSARAGAVTLVDTRRLRVVRILRGFGSPHIAMLVPNRDLAYVTDDARGQLAVVDVKRRRVARKLFVGLGAHHLAISPDSRRCWVALGERARSIAVVDTTRPDRPRLIGHVNPRGAAHDVAFAPDGSHVWVTYNDRPDVRVFSARAGRPVATIYGGVPPQHVAFGQGVFARYAFITSGKEGMLRIVSRTSGRIVRATHTATGSFNLATAGGLVATSSLQNGVVTELDVRGRELLSKRVAPAARDVALAVLP
jgi:hypothetical protein